MSAAVTISGIVFLCNWNSTKTLPSWIKDLIKKKHVLGKLIVSVESVKAIRRGNTGTSSLKRQRPDDGVDVTCFFVGSTFTPKQLEELKNRVAVQDNSSPDQPVLLTKERMSYGFSKINSTFESIINLKFVNLVALSDMEFPHRRAFLMSMYSCFQTLCELRNEETLRNNTKRRYNSAAKTVAALL